ncbi:MAG: MAPEG family protein [Janthinobacterium lividum]
MTIELKLLAWTLILAIVQIFLPSMLRNRETGVAYNAGPRDEPGPPVGVVTGRLMRAKSNLYETLPLFIAAILTAHIAGREGSLTHIGAWLYLIARVVYVPLYAAGIPYIRSMVWLVSLLGVILAIASLF